jgi:hypothetical protein
MAYVGPDQAQIIEATGDIDVVDRLAAVTVRRSSCTCNDARVPYAQGGLLPAELRCSFVRWRHNHILLE